MTRSRHSDATPRTPAWRRYVAVGDSFTEGLWDVPGAAPPERTTTTDPALVCRGWADLLAGHLAARADHTSDTPVTYANLAIRGRLLGPIVRDQVPAALRLEPDLVSVIGGGNDLLRPNGDPDALGALLEEAVVQVRATGADVLLATGMDTHDSPVVRHTRSRTGVLNANIWTIARRHGAYVVDVWGMRSLRDWRMWAPDRIHLTTEGHRRVAQAALVALGLEPDDERWDDPLTPLPGLPRSQQVRTDAVWLRDHAYPWATRRLRGRSSGDTRRAKRPALEPVEPG
ncbi:SGNH/GDSL hydrolase family protein [Actinotalea sp. M2MS4P-6]|uniref:SGNH/GDSL hydrolase family protein n=1 Tax=Actinotalea sp. M2MS4P-6 TaxID=2983762 RepID=UPI00398C5751